MLFPDRHALRPSRWCLVSVGKSQNGHMEKCILLVANKQVQTIGTLQIQTIWDIFGPQNGGLPFFYFASEMMSGVGGVYASVKTKHCNTAREEHFGESAPTKPQIGGWVGAVHRIWVTFGVPVRGTSQICLRGIRHEDWQYECKHTTYRD